MTLKKSCQGADLQRFGPTTPRSAVASGPIAAGSDSRKGHREASAEKASVVLSPAPFLCGHPGPCQSRDHRERRSCGGSVAPRGCPPPPAPPPLLFSLLP